MVTVRVRGPRAQGRRSDNGVRSKPAPSPAQPPARRSVPDPAAAERIKAAVLVGSLVAACLAALLIKRRNGIYRRLYEEETRDDDHDGIPDIYQRTSASER